MSTIDDIKSRLDIVEIISARVPLRKTGRSFVGFCPFHANTRTPAFTVYPDSQSFYCFGCHASGTVFDFVMRTQGLEFREALEQLAAQAGVQLKERSAEDVQQDQQRTRLLEINVTAAKYFNYVLLNLTRGQPGRDYVSQRGLDQPTIESFQLGYSLNEWNHLLTYLTERKGFTPEEVEAAGLAVRAQQTSSSESNPAQPHFYDRFRGRLIFPIRNAKGEVVGFGGRALGDAQPKYLNTPQTLLFDKSQVLYGLDLARDAIRSSDATVVVEGYVDVITAHQYGFRNVVAPLGTALTQGHVALLKKLSHNVYLALDADAAGQRATLRGLDVLQGSGAADGEAHAVTTAQGLVRWESDVTLRIIKMPAGRDPDEVIKADPNSWKALLDSAVPVMDFYIEAYTTGLDLSQPADQRTVLDRLLPLLAQLDGAQQRVYIARLEQVIGIRAELILDLLREQTSTAGQRRRTGNARRTTPNVQRPPRGEAIGPTGAHRPGVQDQGAGAVDQDPASVTQRRSSPLTRDDHLLALMLRYPSIETVVTELLAQGFQKFPQAREVLGGTPEDLLERTENRLIWQAWQQTTNNKRQVGDNALDEGADQTASEAGQATAGSSHNGGIEQSATGVRTRSAEELTAWVQELDAALHSHAKRLLALELPRAQEYRYRQEAEGCARHLRLEQARRWQRRLSQQLGDTDVEAEYERLVALLIEVQNYLASISTPRRTATFPDLRDILGRET
ncbi:MAG: DNA primase [Chloroflexales bacterium]|nr:DNA primase [Chloroflexales bacterium]